MIRYAEEKYEEATDEFRAFYDRVKDSLTGPIDQLEVAETLIDLDAVIPALEGMELGRALTMKAHALYYMQPHYGREPSLVFDRSLYVVDPAAWQAIHQARDVLRQHDPDSLRIADAVLEILRPYFEDDSTPGGPTTE